MSEEVQLWGGGDYSMRVWLDPQKVAERDLTAAEVVNAIRAERPRWQQEWSVVRPPFPERFSSYRLTRRGRLKNGARVRRNHRQVICHRCRNAFARHREDRAWSFGVRLCVPCYDNKPAYCLVDQLGTGCKLAADLG